RVGQPDGASGTEVAPVVHGSRAARDAERDEDGDGEDRRSRRGSRTRSAAPVRPAAVRAEPFADTGAHARGAPATRPSPRGSAAPARWSRAPRGAGSW